MVEVLIGELSASREPFLFLDAVAPKGTRLVADGLAEGGQCLCRMGADGEHRQLAESLGVFSYLIKPVEERALINEISQFVSAPTAAKPR